MTGPQTPPPGSRPPYGPPGQGGYGAPGYGSAPGYGAPGQYGQYGQYGPPTYGAPGYGRPKPTSTTGPKITLGLGVVAFVAAIVIGVLGARSFLEVIPTDVLRLDGSPGDGVLGVVAAPGAGEVALPGDATYTLFLVTERRREAELLADPVVTGSDGTQVPVRFEGFSTYVEMGTTRADLVGTVTVETSDMYTIEAPGTVDGQGGRIYVTEGEPMSGMLGGVFGGVVGVLAAVGVGVVALVLILVGAIMWGVRRGNARQAGLL